MSEQQGSDDKPEEVHAAGASPGTDLVPYVARREKTGAARAASARITSKWASRRTARMVAIALVAAAVGATTGAAAALGLSHLLSQTVSTATADEATSLKQTIARLQTELGALKANTDHAAKASAAQLAQTTERIDKLARTNDETAAKLAKVADVQDKLRAAATPPPNAAAAPADVTGSIPTTPKIEARIGPVAQPILDGWVLAKVSRGGAIVASRTGFYEVYPGDPLPGAGRVEAVRYQDGRWVVITQKGLIIRR